MSGRVCPRHPQCCRRNLSVPSRECRSQRRCMSTERDSPMSLGCVPAEGTQLCSLNDVRTCLSSKFSILSKELVSSMQRVSESEEVYVNGEGLANVPGL